MQNWTINTNLFQHETENGVIFFNKPSKLVSGMGQKGITDTKGKNDLMNMNVFRNFN